MVEAPGIIVPNVWISYPYNGARNRKVDSLRGLNTDLGHGLVGMAKIFKHSVTAVRSEGAKKENDTLCIRQLADGLARYKRLTQLIRRCRPAGRQDEPNPAMLSFTWNPEKNGTGCGSPALSPNYFE